MRSRLQVGLSSHHTPRTLRCWAPHGAGHPMALPPGTPFGSNRPTNQMREAAAQARVDPQEQAGICHLRLDQFISLSRSLPRFFLNRFW